MISDPAVAGEVFHRYSAALTSRINTQSPLYLLIEKQFCPMKFCLVDRIVDVTPGESIATCKNVTLAEEYLHDHFPGFAVLPGVMMVEAMVQSCAWLSRITDGFTFSALLLKQARAVKFNSFLKPGQTLHVTAKLRKNEDDQVSFVASGTVDGASAVSARLILSKQNLADRRPEMAENDARMIAAMKELYAQIVPAGH
ncbi:MAG: beta-hydroxyacyl-ACP dehydratase [Planctomycetaceae bacterium]